MSDDIQQQLKERLAREQARHDRQRTSSMDGNAMDVDETHSTSDNNNNRNNSGDTTTTTNTTTNTTTYHHPHHHQENKDTSSSSSSAHVQDLQHSLRNRQQKIDELSKQLQDLQQRFQEERIQYQREQAELTRLTGGSANTGATIHDVTMSDHPSSHTSSGGASTQTHQHDHSRQIMTDEELAQHLAAQFEREAQEEEEEERQRQRQRQQQPQQQQRSGHPNAPTVRTFSYGDPNAGGFFQMSSSSSSDGHPMGGDPFGPSGMMGFGFDSIFNDPIFGRRPNRDIHDPFSRMRIHPRTLFPGLMFGGALVDDNADYDTLMRLFPPVPRGADHSAIEQLPEDVYKTKPKETKSKEKEKHTSERKEQEVKEEGEDEFHKCCICLESFKEGDAIRRLPCMHIFHREEIDNWLSRNHLCPICRTPIEHNEPPSHHQ